MTATIANEVARKKPAATAEQEATAKLVRMAKENACRGPAATGC